MYLDLGEIVQYSRHNQCCDTNHSGGRHGSTDRIQFPEQMAEEEKVSDGQVFSSAEGIQCEMG